MPKKIKPRSVLALKRYLREQYQHQVLMFGPGDRDGHEWLHGSTDEIERIYQFMFRESIVDWYQTKLSQKEAK